MRVPARWRDGRRRPLLRGPTLAYASAHRRLPLSLSSFFDAGGDERGGGFRLVRGRFRLGRRRNDASAEAESADVDESSREAVSRRPVDLIGRYSATAHDEPAVVEPTTPESAVLPVPVADGAPEAAGHALGDGHAQHADAVTGMLDEHIAAAREAHFALALVAVRVAQAADERSPDQEELRKRLSAALPDVLGSAEQPELLMDADERLIWLAVPGVLPRRAAEVVTCLRELLNEGGLAPVALAVCGYPRDGTTAEHLVEHCRAALERTA
jgi:hypothetical protein